MNISVTTEKSVAPATLVQEWLFYSDGLLDERQTQELIRKSREYIRYHA